MIPLHGLAALSPADQTLLNEFCRAPTVEPQFNLIHKAFEHFADTTPTAVAAVHSGRRITYHELEVAANALGSRLVARGLRSRERVCLVVSRSIEMLVAIMAILKCGCQYVPLDGKVVTDQTLLHIVHDARARFLLCLEEFRSKSRRYSGSSTMIEVIDCCAEEVPSPSQRLDFVVEPNDGAYVTYTSGTTGKPKGVDVSHLNVTNLLTAEPGNLGIQSGSKIAQLLSVSFDMAAWEILGALTNGGTLYIRTSDWAATLREVDTIIATPSILGTLKQEQYHNLKVVALAGEPCPKPLADSWSQTAALYNCCGPTEVTIVNTMNRQFPGQEVSIGKPVPNTSVYILDDDEQPVPIGETGIMWAGGDCVTRGYLNLPAETANRFKLDKFTGDGSFMYNTGDRGKWRADGTLEHLGRIDDQVKVHGFRVDLAGVSAVVESYQGVRTACTILHETCLWSFYEANPDTPEALIESHIKQYLPYYAVPCQHLVENLPKTPNGKVDKKTLAIWAEGLRAEKLSLQTALLPVAPSAALTTDHGPRVPPCASSSSSERETEKPYEPRTYELPEKKGIHGLRALRHGFFSLYRRFFLLVLLGNLVAVFVLAVRGQQTQNLSLSDLATATSANITVSILMRQEYVINFLWTTFCSVPTGAPLFIRRHCAKIGIHLGGIHSGCGIAAVVWFIAFTVVATKNLVATGERSAFDVGVLVFTYLLIVLLISIVALAHPKFRTRYHNHFELAHRLLGWTALALFWAQSLTFIASSLSPSQPSFSYALTRSPPLYLLLTSTISVILPWLRLRRVTVRPEFLSSHAIRLHFNYCTPVPGTAVRISERPLIEWHAFATVARPGQKGFSLVVSNAGDWTSRQIKRQPTSLYVRGIPACGVLRIVPLFRRIVLVATGSGIGPCLPIILAQRVPMRVFWSTPHPEDTFGQEIVNGVRAADPNAVIHNTRTMGKPDMVAIIWCLLLESHAEAVCIISNQKLTRKVVYAMEARGIPAYGAIWDS